jgi:hypothetical protein
MRTVVVDVKTAARSYSQLQADLSLQLSIYLWAASRLFENPVEYLAARFDVITKTKKPKLQR